MVQLTRVSVFVFTVFDLYRKKLGSVVNRNEITWKLLKIIRNFP